MVRRLVEKYEPVSPMKRARTVRPDMNGRVPSYDINLLGRLIADCRYFLGYGNGYEGHLWAGSVEDQIEKMRELYNRLGSRQDMITLDEIDDYEQRMLDVKYGNDDVYEGCGYKKKSKKRTKKMTESLDYDYISFATQLAEDIYDELKEEVADDNTDIGKLYTDEYPDCFYCYFKVFPYYGEDDDVLTYRVYGDQYTKFIDDRLEYTDLEGYFRSAWSDYKIDTRNKCIEIGIKFMFNNY